MKRKNKSQKVEIAKLTKKDIGAYVIYTNSFGDEELGRIKGWTDKSVWVVYDCEGQWGKFRKYTAKATPPKKLYFLPENQW